MKIGESWMIDPAKPIIPPKNEYEITRAELNTK